MKDASAAVWINSEISVGVCVFMIQFPAELVQLAPPQPFHTPWQWGHLQDRVIFAKWSTHGILEYPALLKTNASLEFSSLPETKLTTIGKQEQLLHIEEHSPGPSGLGLLLTPASSLFNRSCSTQSLAAPGPWVSPRSVIGSRTPTELPSSAVFPGEVQNGHQAFQEGSCYAHWGSQL